MSLEDVLPVELSLALSCKGCDLGFEREQYEGKFWHVWEGRAYPCVTPEPRAQEEESDGNLANG